MYEDTEQKQPWKFKIGNISPLLPRKNLTSDDIDIERRESNNNNASLSLSDDEVFVKSSPKRIKVKFQLKHSSIKYNNNNYESTSVPRAKTISPEKRPNISNGIPKKKVRFALPDDEDNSGSEQKNDEYKVCCTRKRTKRHRMSDLDYYKMQCHFFCKKKKGNNETDTFNFFSSDKSSIEMCRKRKLEEAADSEAISLKLLCAQFAHTDLGK